MRVEELKKLIVYCGPSMHPLLRCPDVLTIRAYNGRKIRRGDVVVFESPENKKMIVHRVQAVSPAGIRTRGDNNTLSDKWLLNPSDIIGRLEYAQRKNKQVRIYGGIAGRLTVVINKAKHQSERIVSALLRFPYRYLVKTRIFIRLLPSAFRPKAFVFKRPYGEETQVLIGRTVVARYKPRSRRWLIRRPFKLFVDESIIVNKPAKPVCR